MSRSTQFIGHTKEVENFLKTCNRLKKIKSVYGMFGEVVYDLYKWKDKFGNIWSEFVQAEPWSSGPMIFLCVRTEQNKERGWKEDESVKGKEVDYEKGLYWV